MNKITRSKALFSGLGVALVTPFLENSSVDYQSLTTLALHTMKGGVDFLVLFGTTGESPTVSIEERKEALYKVHEVTEGKIPIVLGVGGNDTLRLVERLHNLPNDLLAGILSVTPYYNKPSQEGLYKHFSLLAENTPLPLILYNIMGRTGVDLLPDTVQRLRRDYPQRIVAIKEATGKLERVVELVESNDEDFTVLSGDDHLTHEFMRAGARGAISVVANIYPQWVKSIIADYTSPEAQYRDMALGQCYKQLFAEGNPSGIKEWLHLMGHIATPTLRLPLVNVSEALREEMKASIENLQKLGAC
ncbi:4-hydroxy-tetrahydrodipicolinate synthase [Porphyromonas circumdentaria]|uniref:4-hydroxy-tetrahydrodipicolinate synthase n=1 Tax=Porphyromonas circumdentaria TaxID=29524 RepID=A0A1T4PG96_9PORP|nr:4-hydroxy-tetrahydrodipicolinate synthase [Porphyromonas circumdentaria]MBB6275715.1 4-hydroxy-tetrahydrodipicolinate synthase [Porphyromonas circumdentaria]MDO4722710.1 4-hydroxy-tetrahydrodipicolinate synthase [Porphyromonas circumdentaria]SJZ90347.1 4-hydroxy-tetrahydrodipicolinate synthase [Porphyromonas circumdentaria]